MVVKWNGRAQRDFMLMTDTLISKRRLNDQLGNMRLCLVRDLRERFEYLLSKRRHELLSSLLALSYLRKWWLNLLVH